MATRPRRARADEPSYEDTDIDEENNSNDEQATPRPKKKARKQMSEIMADASFSADKQPLKPIDLNDDEAERRRRRKSVKVAAAAAAVPLDEPATPTRRPRPGQQVNAVEQSQPVAVPLDVMNTNFEEWMKMATDNVRAPVLRVLTFSPNTSAENQCCKFVELCFN